MRWIVLASDGQKEEFLSKGIKKQVEIEWIDQRDEFLKHPRADVFFDLEFEDKSGEAAFLKQLLPKTVFISNVVTDNIETAPFISILAWPGFLQRETAEVWAEKQNRQMTEHIMALLNRKVSWCDNPKGFISARVIAMIINEAYLALEENVSSKDEIDIAMKLGTNYPYGPFEWAQKIGHGKITRFLEHLSEKDKKYVPGRLLKEEAK